MFRSSRKAWVVWGAHKTYLMGTSISNALSFALSTHSIADLSREVAHDAAVEGSHLGLALDVCKSWRHFGTR